MYNDLRVKAYGLLTYLILTFGLLVGCDPAYPTAPDVTPKGTTSSSSTGGDVVAPTTSGGTTSSSSSTSSTSGSSSTGGSVDDGGTTSGGTTGGTSGMIPDGGDVDGGEQDGGMDAGPVDLYDPCIKTWTGACDTINTDCVNAAQTTDNNCVTDCYNTTPPSDACLKSCADVLNTGLSGCSTVQTWCTQDGIDGGLGIPDTQCAQFNSDAGVDTACGECTGLWNTACNATETTCQDVLTQIVAQCLTDNGSSGTPQDCHLGNTTDSDAGTYCPQECYSEWQAFLTQNTPCSIISSGLTTGDCENVASTVCASVCKP